jgi:hypothetical protein
MVGLAIGMAIANGSDFLHWRGRRSTRVLYIDGEMSRQLMKKRLQEESARLGAVPNTFFTLNREDVEGMQPVNTPDGQQFIEKVVSDLGGVDLIIFDNVMCLIAGDQKDEEGWRQTMPWVLNLTRQHIGQIWVHHTGHDESHSYGTKTREWQMDTTAHLTAIKRPDTDVSFQWEFRKARARTPETRFDFADVRVALVNNRWIYEHTSANRKGSVSALTQKFFEALQSAIDLNNQSRQQLRTRCYSATLIEWQGQCVKRGLIDKAKKPDAARATFSQNKVRLIAANLIACDETKAWVID